VPTGIGRAWQKVIIDHAPFHTAPSHQANILTIRAFVESTINQVVSRRFVKKQQMQWTLRGAHLLLQTRTKVLNNELDEVFRHWYRQFRAEAA
jgi:hypothetical protein